MEEEEGAGIDSLLGSYLVESPLTYSCLLIIIFYIKINIQVVMALSTGLEEGMTERYLLLSVG